MFKPEIQGLGIGPLVTHKETSEGLIHLMGPFGNLFFEALGMPRTPTVNANWHSSQIMRLNWGRGVTNYL